jgi:hypothetical protein
VVTSNSLTPVEEAPEEVKEYNEYSPFSSSTTSGSSEDAPLQQFHDYEYKPSVTNEVGRRRFMGSFSLFLTKINFASSALLGDYSILNCRSVHLGKQKFNSMLTRNFVGARSEYG